MVRAAVGGLHCVSEQLGSVHLLLVAQAIAAGGGALRFGCRARGVGEGAGARVDGEGEAIATGLVEAGAAQVVRLQAGRLVRSAGSLSPGRGAEDAAVCM